MAKLQRRIRCTREVGAVLMLALSMGIPVAGVAQTSDALDWKGKLQFHAEASYAPKAWWALRHPQESCRD